MFKRLMNFIRPAKRSDVRNIWVLVPTYIDEPPAAYDSAEQLWEVLTEQGQVEGLSVDDLTSLNAYEHLTWTVDPDDEDSSVTVYRVPLTLVDKTSTVRYNVLSVIDEGGNTNGYPSNAIPDDQWGQAGTGQRWWQEVPARPYAGLPDAADQSPQGGGKIHGSAEVPPTQWDLGGLSIEESRPSFQELWEEFVTDEASKEFPEGSS